MVIIKKIFTNYLFLLFLLVILGAFLRLWRLSDIPVGLHIDEAQVGYNAYSLYKTGFDETGKFLPTHLTLWKVDRPLAISYLTIPGILVFGLTELGTRIDTALIGIISILLVFILTEKIFNNRAVSFITAFTFSISPWHVVLSRATSEAIISLAFYIFGGTFCFLAVRKNSPLYVFLAYLAFVMSFFLYHSTRITIPFLFLFFAILTLREKKKVGIVFLFFIVIYLIFPLIPLSQTSLDRFKLVSVLHNEETKLLLEEQIREDGSLYPVILTRLFHNKIVNYSIKLVNNFLYYFTYDFLIFKGGFPFRYIVPNMGVIYFLELPLIIWGIISLLGGLYKERRAIVFLIFFWIFLGVLPAALTVEESPNVNRALFILPAFQWLMAIGFINIYNRIKGRGLVGRGFFLGVVLFYTWNVFYFLHQYSVHSFTHRPWYRFYEMKEVVDFMTKEKDKYKKVVLSFNSTEPYIFFLFYNKTDPAYFQYLINKKGLDYVCNNMGNIKISRRDCPIIHERNQLPTTLAVYKVQCFFPRGARVLKKFRYPDGEVSMVAVDFPKDYTLFDKDLKYEPEKVEQ